MQGARERRQFVRVPVAGAVRWRCGTRRGECETVDISPGGVSLRMPTRHAAQLGPRISVDVDLGGGATWNLATDASLVRRQPQGDGSCIVGIQFPAPAAPTGG